MTNATENTAVATFRKPRQHDFSYPSKLLAALTDLSEGGEKTSRTHKKKLVEMGLAVVEETRTHVVGRTGFNYVLSGQGKSRLALLQRNAAKAAVKEAKAAAKEIATRAAEAAVYAATLMAKAVEAQNNAAAIQAAADQAKVDADAMEAAQVTA